jgi:hypothetical protein
VNIIGVASGDLPAHIVVEPDKVRTLRLLLTLAPRQLHAGSEDLKFVLTDPVSHEARVTEARFVSGHDGHDD